MFTAYRALGAKLEPINGVPATVTAADATFKSFNPQLTPDDNTIERELQAGAGQEKGEPGPKSGKLTFRTELAAPVGAVPAWASVFLPACDMEATANTFGFVRGTNTISAYFWEDGSLRKFYGGRGNGKLVFPTGQIPAIDWEFTGKYLDAHADAALVSPTYEDALSPIFAGGTNTCTIGSFQPHCANLEIDMGNVVILRETPNDPHTDKSGYVCAAIPNRKPGGSIDPEAVAVATVDWRSLRANRTLQTLTVNLGSAAGSNRITISSSALQITKTPRGDRNGLLTDQLGFMLTGSNSLTIAFPDAA